MTGQENERVNSYKMNEDLLLHGHGFAQVKLKDGKMFVEYLPTEKGNE